MRILVLAALVACGAPSRPPPPVTPTRPPPAAPTVQPERIAVLDTHVHLLSPKNFGDKAITADTIIPLLDEAGVAQAIVLSAAYRLKVRAARQAENEFLLAETAKHPTRLVGFCGVHLGDSSLHIELQWCKDKGLRGVKVHPNASGIDLLDPADLDRLAFTFQRAAELGLLVLIDGNASDERAAGNLIRTCLRNPQTTIIIAHALNLHYRRLVTFEMIRLENPDMPRNVFVDVSGIVPFFVDSPERDNIVWALRKFGIDRVVFGSDFPVFTPAQALRAFERYPFTPDERSKILRQNLARLLEAPSVDPTRAP